LIFGSHLPDRLAGGSSHVPQGVTASTAQEYLYYNMVLLGNSGAGMLLNSPLFMIPDCLDTWEFCHTLDTPNSEFMFYRHSNDGPLFVMEFHGVDVLEPLVVQDLGERARLKELILSRPTELWLDLARIEGPLEQYAGTLMMVRRKVYLPPFPRLPEGHPALKTHRLYSFHWPREGGVTVTDMSSNPPWAPMCPVCCREIGVAQTGGLTLADLWGQGGSVPRGAHVME
jgi:hypothetical protein